MRWTPLIIASVIAAGAVFEVGRMSELMSPLSDDEVGFAGAMIGAAAAVAAAFGAVLFQAGQATRDAVRLWKDSIDDTINQLNDLRKIVNPELGTGNVARAGELIWLIEISVARFKRLETVAPPRSVRMLQAQETLDRVPVENLLALQSALERGPGDAALNRAVINDTIPAVNTAIDGMLKRLKGAKAALTRA